MKPNCQGASTRGGNEENETILGLLGGRKEEQSSHGVSVAELGWMKPS